MKQAEYLTKELSEFVNKLDLPSSIITSYSDIEVPFNWGSFCYKANTGKAKIHYKNKINQWSYWNYQHPNIITRDLVMGYLETYKRLPKRVVKELTEAMKSNLEELLLDSAFKNRNIDLFVTHPLILEFDEISQKMIDFNQDEKIIWLDDYSFALIKVLEDKYNCYVELVDGLEYVAPILNKISISFLVSEIISSFTFTVKLFKSISRLSKVKIFSLSSFLGIILRKIAFILAIISPGENGFTI